MFLDRSTQDLLVRSDLRAAKRRNHAAKPLRVHGRVAMVQVRCFTLSRYLQNSSRPLVVLRDCRKACFHTLGRRCASSTGKSTLLRSGQPRYSSPPCSGTQHDCDCAQILLSTPAHTQCLMLTAARCFTSVSLDLAVVSAHCSCCRWPCPALSGNGSHDS